MDGPPDYELLSRIASGGMAEIWLARARAPRPPGEQLCVIKKLLPQHLENEDYVRMFLEEGRLGASLLHPNIVRMFESGFDGGTHWLAMQYLHGEDLRVVNRVNRAAGRTMPLAHAVDVVTRASRGLHYAHELRAEDGSPLEIVHRDVSPHNVFLTFDGEVKVVDFGIAKSTGRRWETKHGTLKGKVPYMSPEQIKARRLDRRTDIYAMGVMLYELVLGRRPYVLSAAGDFAMMMAIARHDVRAPRELAPDVDPELEAIILRAMTYDPNGRYATMLEMATALERFAAARGLPLGPAPLAAYLEELFGARVVAWRAAQREDLAAHAVLVEGERAESGLFVDDSDGDATAVADGATLVAAPSIEGRAGPAPPSSAALVASSSSAISAVLEMSGVTVVGLQGRLDERFEGAALGGSLSGTVLFDLAGVERVTSFGVREWLEMMKAIDEQDDADVWLARCPEAIVNQMSLIRAFAGRARLLSFQAPFLCDDCGNGFSLTLDCARDASWFAGGRGPAPACPRCGGAAKLDDDPAFFAFAAPHAGVEVPEGLRAVLETIEQSARADDVVDKTVTEDETRVRVHRDVDRTVRWNRVFDGIEGRLVVDFRGVPRVSPEGASNFARALQALGADVTAIEILECPVTVLVALGDRRASERLRIASVAFAGRCVACAAARAGAVPMSAVTAAMTAGGAPLVGCRRCNAALDVREAASLLAAAFTPPAPAAGDGAASASAAPADHLAPSSSAAPREDATPLRAPRPGHARAIAIAIAVALGAATLALGAAVTLRAARVLRAPTTSTAGGAPAERAPPAEEATIEVTPEAVEIAVTVQGSAGEADVARARSLAIVAAVGRLEQDVAPDVREANAAAAPNAGPLGVDERFIRDVGAFASPERLAARVDQDGGERRLSTRYRISRDGWDRAVAFYGARRDAFGLTLTRALPTRRDGLVVVARAAAAAIPRGAVLVSLDGQPGGAHDGFEVLSNAAPAGHEAVFVVGAESLTVELN